MNVSDPRRQTPPDASISRQLVQLTSALATSGSAPDPVRVVSEVLHAVPSAQHGGITLLREGRAPFSLAASDGVPEAVDRLQHASGEGPFREPTTEHGVVLVDDLASDPRWPVFGPECAVEVGVHSMLCLRLVLGGTDRAALTLYSTRPAAFGDGDRTRAGLLGPFAALAGEAHLRAEDVDNLTAALGTSRQIGTAVGIVMARRQVPSEEAFALLRKASMDLNRKVYDIAAEVEMTGDLPVRTSALLQDGRLGLT
ncbi:GAF and ANTAR domain-containing protein [Knoellia aerolata]|uniref:ANTAR domain-containing protein n=1 Tax=Knoellia aerolata DSM 18566 TaxID=1385519 RepID=A0A0A0JVJ8_9MICO|nr:GAF and ANTAR domain-containing protein [Knoellia aerolata]KGN39656.1 hypothetical protein N801_19655 [Knoellia aerolata DSM 18566]